MNYLFLLLLLSSFAFGAADPWQPYENNGKGKGNGGGYPIVPEPHETSWVIGGSALAVYGLWRWKTNNDNKKKSK